MSGINVSGSGERHIGLSYFGIRLHAIGRLASASNNLDHQQCVDVVPDARIAVSRPTHIREHVMFDVYQVIRLGSYFTGRFNDDPAITSEYRAILR